MNFLRRASTVSSSLGAPFIRPQHVQEFWQKGYMRLPSVVPKELRPNLLQWINEIKSWPGKTDKAYLQYEEIDHTGKRVLCTSENFARYHSGLNGILRNPRVLGCMSDLLGSQAYLFKEKINYKLPMGGGYPPHTDAPSYIHIDHEVQRHISMLICVEKATPENGCLEVVAGSHLEDIETEKDQPTLSRKWEAKQKWEPLPMEPGEALVFDSWLAHRSSDNKSPKGRASIYATYNGGKDLHEAYYAHRSALWPATAQRDPNNDYRQGAAVYAWATPMETVTTVTAKL
ncbi:hypothetical protein M422DRAFT_38179 [Sphaerobolus stellatus SS14]|uniref:Phytanoyl-CoA dioxygenase n=1 Tax=Sphaerobolus stellatus (strain SS14) TaxID=990650 RepID=A0A0C9TBP2_SPHS4|nr:hypothetical protein M422DRAFT_38179 [Sphaerobolus stellatus SS14]